MRRINNSEQVLSTKHAILSTKIGVKVFVYYEGLLLKIVKAFCTGNKISWKLRNSTTDYNMVGRCVMLISKHYIDINI